MRLRMDRLHATGRHGKRAKTAMGNNVVRTMFSDWDKH